MKCCGRPMTFMGVKDGKKVYKCYRCGSTKTK